MGNIDHVEGTIDNYPFVAESEAGTLQTNEQVARYLAANYHKFAATEITTIAKNLKIDMEEQVLMPGYPPVWVFIGVTPA